jgi:hypothetical protein
MSTGNIDTNSELKIIFKCFKCDTTNGFLLLGAKDGEQVYTCTTCLHYQMLDVSMDLFLKDSKEYEGKYYNPITNK